MATVMEHTNYNKIYLLRNIDLSALNGVALQVEQGQMTASAGLAGPGKSVKHIVGRRDAPADEPRRLDILDVSKMSANEQAIIRRLVRKLNHSLRTSSALARGRLAFFDYTPDVKTRQATN